MEKHDLTVPRSEAPARVPQRAWCAPLVDIYENPDEHLLVFDVPGVPSGGVDLRLDKGVLTLEAVRSPTTGWRRSFQVPDSVDGEHIGAHLENGVLTVHLPKKAQLRPRKIAVEEAR